MTSSPFASGPVHCGQLRECSALVRNFTVFCLFSIVWCIVSKFLGILAWVYIRLLIMALFGHFGRLLRPLIKASDSMTPFSQNWAFPWHSLHSISNSWAFWHPSSELWRQAWPSSSNLLGSPRGSPELHLGNFLRPWSIGVYWFELNLIIWVWTYCKYDQY